jgi:hypothetical protein
MSEPCIEDYTIGWICALQEEYEAACRMLDDEFEGPETSDANDNNTYVFGRISEQKWSLDASRTADTASAQLQSSPEIWSGRFLA